MTKKSDAPAIRFKGFSDAWEQRKVGDLLIERNQQAPMSDEYPLMAFIANEGVAPKGERYDRSALVTDTVNKLYKKTEKGDFIYSSNNLETGSIGLNKYGKACISPVYSIFEPTGIADSDFLGRRLVRKDFINAMVKWRQGVIYGQWRIHESDFLKIEITVPSVEEQRKIGAYLDQLDNLITLHQRKCALLFSSFQALISMMFTTSTFSWEQRKFGEITSKYEDPVPTPHDGYYRLGIRSHAKGTFHSYVAKGQELETAQMHRVAAGNFIVNITFGWEHAVAITDKNDAGKLVSHRFPQFSFAEGMVPEFFRYVIVDEKFRHHLWLASPGGAGRNRVLKLDEMLNYLMRFPSRDEQIKIAEFFRHLDNLITLHQRKCISFTGRAGRLISTVNKKRITSSWEQRKLTEFVEFFSGLTYTPNDVQENGTLVLRSSNVSNGEVVDADNVYVNPQVVNSENVKVGDIVVVVRNGSRSLIGKHAQIKAFMPNTVIGAFMTGIRSECPEFTNALLNTSRFEEEIAMNMGATINQITGYMFSKMEFKVPCLDEQKKIGEYFEKLDRLVTLHQRKPFLMKWRTSDANRNQTNRLVL